MRNRCVWELEDEDYGVYKTECGKEFQVMTDNIEKNGFRYCVYCGLPITEMKKKEEEESE